MDRKAKSEIDDFDPCVLRVRGLPWSASKDDIVNFFEGCNLKNGPNGIHLTMSREGRPSGEAYVEFETPEDATKGLEKDNEHLGSRYIEVFRSKENEMEWALRRCGLDGEEAFGDACVRLRGLPFGCSKEEIAQFFTGLEIVRNGITLPTDFQGRSTGEAYVQFSSINMTYCDKLLQLLTCMEQAAKDTNVQYRITVQDVLNSLKDMCQNGTEANRVYIENRECVKDSITDYAEAMKCTEPMVKEISRLTPEERKNPKITGRISCKYADSLNTCFLNLIKTKCGYGGVKFYKVLQDPSTRLLKKTCLEIGNGAGVATANMYFSIFQIIAALFLIKWFSQ